jgi:hypothetical protein
MSIMLDLIGSSLLLGTILLTIVGVNANLVSETAATSTEFHTQTELIQLGRIIEFDLYKIGYAVPSGTHDIVTADSTHLKFKTNLWNVPGKVDSVEYILGGYVTSSVNPNDRVLTRYENTTGVLINYSITLFNLKYYNSRDSLLNTPVTGGMLDSIKSIRVYMTLESPTPVDFDSSYAAGYYAKWIYPRNL